MNNSIYWSKGAWWWLRSPGNGNWQACVVREEGKAGWNMRDGVNGEAYGVRPALYIKNDIADKLHIDLYASDNLLPEHIDSAPILNDEGYVVFGSYEQDNDLLNGSEPIEWQILESDGNSTLLISRYVWDYQPYNTERVDVTWETCSMRQWLNDDTGN